MLFSIMVYLKTVNIAPYAIQYGNFEYNNSYLLIPKLPILPSPTPCASIYGNKIALLVFPK